MYLSRIIIKDFKNILSADISFSPKINCICGDNGVGKTNFLDAVYYLSMTKSFLSSSDRYTFTYGKSEAVIHGHYVMDGSAEDIAIAVRSDGNKTVRRNDKAYKRISEHIGRVPVVMTAPSDISLIHDSGEERRRFLNMMISQMDQEYLRSVVAYNRLLKQRNSLLKQDAVPDMLLDTISEQMYGFSEYIHSSRAAAVQMLDAGAASFYNMISGGRESVGIRYRSDLSGDVRTADVFEAAKQKDKLLGYTTAGVQRDDMEFSMDGYPIRKCASQGQQKSFIVSLKFAQYEIMKKSYGFAPALLLDDVFDKLDMARISNLISMVASSDFGQIFITDSNKIRLKGIVDGFTADRAYFETAGGCFTRI